MRAFLVGLLSFYTLVSIPGCAFTKRVLGITRYRVCIHAREDSNDSAPTPVLVVWPSPEMVTEFSAMTYTEKVTQKRTLGKKVFSRYHLI